MAIKIEYGLLVTTSTTENQTIKEVTASADWTVKLIGIGGGYTAWSATEAYLGFARVQLDTGSGYATIHRTPPLVNSDLDNNAPLSVIPIPTGIVVANGHKIKGICTPASTTSMRWKAFFWGETA